MMDQSQVAIALQQFMMQMMGPTMMQPFPPSSSTSSLVADGHGFPYSSAPAGRANRGVTLASSKKTSRQEREECEDPRGGIDSGDEIDFVTPKMKKHRTMSNVTDSASSHLLALSSSDDSFESATTASFIATPHAFSSSGGPTSSTTRKAEAPTSSLLSTMPNKKKKGDTRAAESVKAAVGGSSRGDRHTPLQQLAIGYLCRQVVKLHGVFRFDSKIPNKEEDTDSPDEIRDKLFASLLLLSLAHPDMRIIAVTEVQFGDHFVSRGEEVADHLYNTTAEKVFLSTLDELFAVFGGLLWATYQPSNIENLFHRLREKHPQKLYSNIKDDFKEFVGLLLKRAAPTSNPEGFSAVELVR